MLQTSNCFKGGGHGVPGRDGREVGGRFYLGKLGHYSQLVPKCSPILSPYSTVPLFHLVPRGKCCIYLRCNCLMLGETGVCN